MNRTSLVDRRSGFDRRSSSDRRHGNERRAGDERRHLEAIAPEKWASTVADDEASTPIAAVHYGRRATDRVTSSNVQNIGASHGIPTTAELLDRMAISLTELVAGIYDASIDHKLWPQVLDRLRVAVHADTCALATHDLTANQGRLEQAVNIDPMYVAAYADFYARHNPWIEVTEAFRKPGSSFTGQELLPDAEVVETDFYRYWLRPQDLFHQLYGVIDGETNNITFLVFGRSRGKGAFWEDDVRLLGRLLPNIRRALFAAQTSRRALEIQRVTLDTLDALPIGVVLLNGGGGILAANSMARDIINNEDVVFNGVGGLGVKLAGGKLRLRDLFIGANPRSNDAIGEINAFSIPRQAPRRPLTAIAMPVKERSQRRAPEDAAAVIFLADPERPVQMDPRRLIRLYNLSRAESRVAALLGEGLRLEQVAERLGLTYETVRKHLKQIFDKTGTDRQAELIRTLVTGPGGLLT